MPPIPRQLLFDAPEISGARLSPDGAWVSWLSPWHGASNLWVAPMAGFAALPLGGVRLTAERGRGIEGYRWAGDSEHVILELDRRGDESWQLVSLRVATGELLELTPSTGIHARCYATSAVRPRWIAAGLNDRDPRWHDVHLIDVASGARELVWRNDDRLFGFVFDRALRLRVALRAEAQGRTIVRFTDRGPVDWRGIDGEDELVTELVGVDGSGETLYWLDAAGREYAALVASSLTAPSDVVLEAAEGGDVTQVLMHPDLAEPMAVLVDALRPSWRGCGRHRRDVAHLVDLLGSTIAWVSQTADGRRWLIARHTPEQAPAYLLVDPTTGGLGLSEDRVAATCMDDGGEGVTCLDGGGPGVSEDRVAATWRREESRIVGPVLAQGSLGKHELARMDAGKVRARDGLEVTMYTTVPHGGRPDGGWPMVLWVHGGPWRRDRYEFDARHQWLASRGYAVLSVNFRGSAGLGKAFLNAGDREWGRRMHDDLLDAVEDRISAGIADRTRVAIAGGSFGGYAALVGLTFTPHVFACGVSICGPSNLVSSQAGKPAYWAAVTELRARRIGDPRTAEGREMLAARSPLHRADQICRPLLIAHGARDPRVKRSESDQVVAAARASGAEVTYLVYGDEGHGLVNPRNRMSFYAIMEAFLAAHLGGQVEPLTGAFDAAVVEIAAGGERIPGLAEAWASRSSVSEPRTR